MDADGGDCVDPKLRAHRGQHLLPGACSDCLIDDHTVTVPDPLNEISGNGSHASCPMNAGNGLEMVVPIVSSQGN